MEFLTSISKSKALISFAFIIPVVVDSNFAAAQTQLLQEAVVVELDGSKRNVTIRRDNDRSLARQVIVVDAAGKVIEELKPTSISGFEIPDEQVSYTAIPFVFSNDVGLTVSERRFAKYLVDAPTSLVKVDASAAERMAIKSAERPRAYFVIDRDGVVKELEIEQSATPTNEVGYTVKYGGLLNYLSRECAPAASLNRKGVPAYDDESLIIFFRLLAQCEDPSWTLNAPTAAAAQQLVGISAWARAGYFSRIAVSGYPSTQGIMGGAYLQLRTNRQQERFSARIGLEYTRASMVSIPPTFTFSPECSFPNSQVFEDCDTTITNYSDQPLYQSFRVPIIGRFELAHPSKPVRPYLAAGFMLNFYLIPDDVLNQLVRGERPRDDQFAYRFGGGVVGRGWEAYVFTDRALAVHVGGGLRLWSNKRDF